MATLKIPDATYFALKELATGYYFRSRDINVYDAKDDIMRDWNKINANNEDVVDLEKSMEPFIERQKRIVNRKRKYELTDEEKKEPTRILYTKY